MAVLEILCHDDKLYELDDGLWRRLSKCGIDLYDRIICVFETVGFRGFSSMGVRQPLIIHSASIDCIHCSLPSPGPQHA